METFSVAFVALVTLCSASSAFAIKCDVCSNLPPETGYTGKSCIEPEVLECPAGYDRCMTIDIKAMFPDIGPFDMKLKNCSISALMCAPDGPANICNRSTINMTSCSMDCCEGDFCNRGESGGSGAEAANLSVWLLGFAAILMALYQKFIS
ncbi:unnamed protein product [Pocillopora meandrina]|uniref:Uncharacterized protein n=1 Tax=Pocillopora meandrina TaxID=46732 RepID=A0AAU9XNA6_9CNID|nr:unnamed protein product [Pocillopora meandrina]